MSGTNGLVQLRPLLSAEECVKCIISSSNSLVTWHLTIRLNAMLKPVELPVGVADLHPGLADVNGNALSQQHSQKGKLSAVGVRKDALTETPQSLPFSVSVGAGFTSGSCCY